MTILHVSNPPRLSLLLTLGLLFGAWAAGAEVSESDLRTRLYPDGRRTPTLCVIAVTNPNGLFVPPNYRCASFEQTVRQTSPTSLTISVRVPERLPEPSQPYPVTDVPDDVKLFLAPSARVQSDNARIDRVAKEILALAPHWETEREVVAAVFDWIRRNIAFSNENPNELTDAVTALERGAAHAVGYSHLSAALLRNLGVPTRIVRAFYLKDLPAGAPADAPRRFARHSLIEVYYPKDKCWALYSPQLNAPVSPRNIYLYSAPDWDQKKHEASKPTSVDPQTRVAVRQAR